MSIITRMRKQTAVYWALSSIDEFGKNIYISPVEISVRWEDVSEQFLDADGNTVMSNARAYTDRDIILGSILMLGLLTDITDAINIKENTGAWEVRRFDKTPNLKATEFLRTAIM